MLNFNTLSIADLKAIHDLATEKWNKKNLSQVERDQWLSRGAEALQELKKRLNIQ